MLSRQEIELAYRLVLGREADPGGLATYERMAAEGLDLEGLRNIFLASPEYRSHFAGAEQQIVDMGHAKVVVDETEPEFGRHIARHGSWEPHIVAIIQWHLKPGDTYVDIGANVGVMAFTAAASVGSSGRVLAFEPHPNNPQLPGRRRRQRLRQRDAAWLRAVRQPIRFLATRQL